MPARVGQHAAARRVLDLGSVIHNLKHLGKTITGSTWENRQAPDFSGALSTL